MEYGIIDSHQHYWSLDLFNYEWMSPENKILYRNFLPEDFTEIRLDNSIEKVVAVQAHQSVEETKWLLELSDKFDFIGGVVGWVDLTSDNLSETLAELTNHPKFKGVRHLVQDEPQIDWILQPKVINGINTLADHSLSYDILIFPKHLFYIPELIEKCPRTSFVIDHLAKPSVISGEIAQWAKDLARVAEFPQVYCKLSGLVTEADHQNWKPEDIEPYAETALKLFGAERLMFGSDYPVCLLAADYKKVLDTCKSFLSPLDQTQQKAVLRDNAINFYRL